MKLRQLADFYLRIDPRSLGIFRILLGVLLLGDVVERWSHIEAFYTSTGVFVGVNRSDAGFSLLESFKTLPQAQGFFVFAAVCYVGLLFGYRTRIFHLLSLVCFLSILNRATLVRAGDDFALAVMLTWTAFLPMGARFSLDALHAEERQPDENASNYNLAAFAAVFQIGLIYLCTAFSKAGTTWMEGTAVYYALQLDQLTRPLGYLVGQLPPEIIKALTWSTLVVEYAALPMILCPLGQPYLRRVIIMALCALHLGIAVTTTLDLFAIKMMATFVLLLRATDWDLLAAAWRRIVARSAVLERWLKGMTRTDAPQRVARAQSGRGDRIARVGFWGGQVVVAFVLTTACVEAYNATVRKRLQMPVVSAPAVMRSFTVRTQLLQRWDLFAPNPSREEGWWVIDGVTESGRRLDPLTGQAPSFEKPADLAARNSRPWRKYLSRINGKSNEQHRAAFARYITRVNHRTSAPGERLASFKLVYMVEKSPARGAVAAPLQRRQMLSWNCFGGGKPPAKAAVANAGALAQVRVSESASSSER